MCVICASISFVAPPNAENAAHMRVSVGYACLYNMQETILASFRLSTILIGIDVHRKKKERCAGNVRFGTPPTGVGLRDRSREREEIDKAIHHHTWEGMLFSLYLLEAVLPL